MPGKYRYPQYPLRINPKIMNKLRYIAFVDSRPVSKEIERLIINHISNFEKANYEITEEDIDRMINEQN